MAGRGEIADVIQQLQTGLNNQSYTRDICAEKASHRPHTIGLHVTPAVLIDLFVLPPLNTNVCPLEG